MKMKLDRDQLTARYRKMRVWRRETADLMILVIGNVGRRLVEWAERKAEERKMPGRVFLDRVEDLWRHNGY